tara:strand:+ start:945 stop:4079 length:3135 start_codon:yes stop_codon:yes gene_type:complete
MVKTIKYNNKKYTYTNISNLAKKLKKTKEEVKKIIKLTAFIEKNKKHIEYRGKKINFVSIPKLSKRLNINKKETSELLSDIKKNETKRYLEINGNIKRIDITQPLGLQEFGIQRVSNKKIISGGKIKKLNISSSLPTDKNLDLYITIDLFVEYWQKKNGNGNRRYSYFTSVKSQDLTDEYFNNVVLSYLGSEPEGGFVIKNITIRNKISGQIFKLKNMILRRVSPLKIDNLYNEIIPNENTFNCVTSYLKKIWGKKIPKNDLYRLQTTNQLYEYCKAKNIKMIAFDIQGNVILANYPTNNKAKFKSLVFIAYNNHLYPLKNTILYKKSKMTTKFINTINIKDKFNEFLEKKILPGDIKIYKDELQGFTVDKTFYYSNNEYDKCKNILSKFGLLDKLTPYTTLNNICGILEKLYIKSNTSSFLPKANKYVKCGFLYRNDKIIIEDDIFYEDSETENSEDEDSEDEFNNDDLPIRHFNKDDIITIDKNKSYADALRSLKYLIKTDIRFNKTYKLKSYSDIIDSHLYIVKVEKSSYLLPNNNIYCGYFLKYCKEQNLKFTIIEGIETETEPNYYKQLIEDIYFKVDDKNDAKFMINVFIGKFNKTNEISDSLVNVKLANIDETKASDGIIIPFNQEYNFICENKYNFDIYNKKPISIQILDEARKVGYEMLLKLKVQPENLIQIKTDSISFIKNMKVEKKVKNYINEEIYGWKYEEFNNIRCPAVKNNIIDGFGYDDIKNDNKLVITYAGAGKTYDIINNVVKQVSNYKVFTPSHASLKEYHEAKINCSVIQKYAHFNSSIPEEEIIIIDEIGMVDKKSCDLIYKMLLLGKQIIAYGDYNQLSPVSSSELSSKIWLNLVFKNQDTMTTNHRNNFTKKYYDSLITSKDKKYLINEVKKYSSSINDADLILVYRNKTRHQYNKIMCDKLDIKYKVKTDKIIFDLDNIKIGTKIISQTNMLSKQDIFNKFVYTITEVKDDTITLDDDIIIKKNELNKIDKQHQTEKFTFAYARTIYSIQGATINSYHYAKEDYKFIDNRSAYTTISRLKI